MAPKQQPLAHSPPPRLQFDDGRRIMEEGSAAAVLGDASFISSCSGPRCNLHISSVRAPQIGIDAYYDIHLTCQSIVRGLQLVDKILAIAGSECSDAADSCDFLCRVALQFPDSLLPDSADVCWQMEAGIVTALIEDLQESLNGVESDSTTLEYIQQRILPQTFPLVFVLGDTTHGSCCVDTVAAQHLRADWIVHYGPACLTSTGRNTPISYVFGRGIAEFPLDKCVNDVLLQLHRHAPGSPDATKNLVVLYDVVYSYVMADLEKSLVERFATIDLDLQVIIGEISYPDSAPLRLDNQAAQEKKSCCVGSDNGCCEMFTACGTSVNNDEPNVTVSDGAAEVTTPLVDPLVIGGLRVPLRSEGTIKDCTLLYVGGQETNEEMRHLTNILLRCSASDNKSPRDCWVYDPVLQTLTSNATSLCRKQIQQRFYHVQKAKVAGIFGIVVATLTLERFRHVIANVQKMIEDAGRSYYTLAVGKISASKLANFSEIDCFVMVACPEHSLLSNHKDFHAPIVTPLELAMALGFRDWDGFYSLDFSDFLCCGDEDSGNVCDKLQEAAESEVAEELDADGNEGKPYFDVTTGRFVSLKKFQRKSRGLLPSSQTGRDLLSFPGQGRLTEYCSAAAEAWKTREYQGLQAKVGRSEVAPAKPGQHGIASDYGELHD